MTPFPSPSPTLVPAIETRQQLEAVLENIVRLQSERDELRRAQESEIAAVRRRYFNLISELEHYLAMETRWVETWARAHPEAFAANRALPCVHATIGFQALPLAIERASRRWTWSRIALTLATLPWGTRYLRVPPPEVDREALLKDLATLPPTDLRSAGIKVVSGDQFVITPHPSAEAAWPKAA